MNHHGAGDSLVIGNTFEPVRVPGHEAAEEITDLPPVVARMIDGEGYLRPKFFYSILGAPEDFKLEGFDIGLDEINGDSRAFNILIDCSDCNRNPVATAFFYCAAPSSAF